MPDSAFQLAGRQLFRADRNRLSRKAQGGGLCVYINKGWCTNCVLVNSHCSEATEQLTVKCRPHYLPHKEFYGSRERLEQRGDMAESLPSNKTEGFPPRGSSMACREPLL
ncbi:hypothetical protein SRHO_G00055470 [Serrasalmus rhombeus]